MRINEQEQEQEQEDSDTFRELLLEAMPLIFALERHSEHGSTQRYAKHLHDRMRKAVKPSLQDVMRSLLNVEKFLGEEK
jgi:hypothetical protein